jgi:predicted acylesterase/phospholipase RssA
MTQGEAPSPIPAAQRVATIGIALSSGGRAAMAQIGVLEELATAGIRIDAVAGASAGALVGAAYAAGDVAGLRDTVCRLDRRRVLRLFISPGRARDYWEGGAP